MNRFPFRFLGMGLIAYLFAFSAANPHVALAQSYTILHEFQDGSVPNDGAYSAAALVQGSDGNFYGTTRVGGSAGEGTVFKITPSGTETVLHSFEDGSVPNDGGIPEAALVQGSDGDFYGTTVGGGSKTVGTVFKITPAGTVTILHSFQDGSVPNDGAYPSASLVIGSDGNFYGTTYEGGTSVSTDPLRQGYGTVFKITASGAETILHNFRDGSVANDGSLSLAALIQGGDGNFYGTTTEGGTTVLTDPSHLGHGTAFKMTSAGAVTILHSFGDGSVSGDGTSPAAALVESTNGDFYGTTGGGGKSSNGTVFKITSAGAVTILHKFQDGNPADGKYPEDALIQDAAGNLYGTTYLGGSNSAGTVFKITTSGTETILHDFRAGSVNDGDAPLASLIQSTDGSFYGTASQHGANGAGAVFRYDPTGLQPPTVASFTPSEGPIGSHVILTGTNLGNVTAVRFHDAGALAFTPSDDGTMLTVTVPPGAMKGTITVTNAVGSATTVNPFRITYAPVITSFAPSIGPVGTVVVISGTHLDGITRVRFHEADATVYSSNAAGTQLTVTVPLGAKTGTITLDNRDALATTSIVMFTVTP